MPEGDTIMWTAARLDAALAAKTLTRSDLRVPRWATTDLAGRQILPTGTYGKHLFHRFEGGITVHSHLKMEGRWSTLRAPHAVSERSRRAAAAEVRSAERSHATRALFYAGDVVAVGSKLGVLEVMKTAAESDITGRLGPDLLAPTWDGGRAEALRRLRADPDRLLGEALLDQRLVAGLGTFWISEMLFVHRVLPWRSIAEVDAFDADLLPTILDDARTRMLVSGETGVQSSTGRTGDGETKTVHARSGLPCVRCHDTIRVAMAGPHGRERTLFTCPTCQGGLAPNDDGRPQGVLVERGSKPRPY